MRDWQAICQAHLAKCLLNSHLRQKVQLRSYTQWWFQDHSAPSARLVQTVIQSHWLIWCIIHCKFDLSHDLLITMLMPTVLIYRSVALAQSLLTAPIVPGVASALYRSRTCIIFWKQTQPSLNLPLHVWLIVCCLHAPTSGVLPLPFGPLPTASHTKPCHLLCLEMFFSLNRPSTTSSHPRLFPLFSARMQLSHHFKAKDGEESETNKKPHKV